MKNYFSDPNEIANLKVNFYTTFDMQFLNMHLLNTLILHSNDLNQLPFLLSYMSICPPKLSPKKSPKKLF